MLLALIIRSDASPAATRFNTPPELSLQLGFVVYSAGSEIARHSHRRIERGIVGMNEVLLVRKGRCEIDVYGGARELVATRELRAGGVVLLGGGGLNALFNQGALVEPGTYVVKLSVGGHGHTTRVVVEADTWINP